MRVFAQVLYDKAHWIFGANERPEFASDIILVDITGNEDIQEGWNYDETSGEFTEPVFEIIEPELSEVDELRQYLVELDFRMAKDGLSL